MVERYSHRNTEVLGPHPIHVSHSSPQFPHEMAWDLNRVSSATMRRLTVWATTGPKHVLLCTKEWFHDLDKIVSVLSEMYTRHANNVDNITKGNRVLKEKTTSINQEIQRFHWAKVCIKVFKKFFK